ncbi:MAG: hypothetical protein Phog2KO_47780 [Phototrophicaceae bacterium]
MQGNAAVVVLVDRLTKYCRFMPSTKEITSEQHARIFVDLIYKSYGSPKISISDRDPRFTGNFWTQLFRLSKTDSRMSSE